MKPSNKIRTDQEKSIYIYGSSHEKHVLPNPNTSVPNGRRYPNTSVPNGRRYS